VVETKPGLTRLWAEYETSFDEPFHSDVACESAKKAASLPAA
jgi:hypothetical protein